MKGNARKITIVLLLVLTVALAGASIYVGYKISQESQAPEPTSADTNNCCNTPGYVLQNCSAEEEWRQGYYDCMAGNCSACAGGGEVCGNGVCRADKGENSTTCPVDCGGGEPGGCSALGVSCSTGSDCCSGICRDVVNDGISGTVCAEAAYSGDCHTGTGGNPGCPNVRDWGDHNPAADVLAAAQQSPGSIFMAGCTGRPGSYSEYIITSSPNSACQCPTNLSASPGECVTGNCPGCDNPYAYCAPGYIPPVTPPVIPPITPPTGQRCGDGIINQSFEECEVGIPCPNSNETCDLSTCICKGPTEIYCGDGICNQSTEQCETVGGTPTDCSSSTAIDTCRTDCTYCGDGIIQISHGEECDHGGTPTAACNASCQDVIIINEAVCNALDRTDTGNIGPDEIEEFVLSIHYDSTTAPYDYANIMLRVVPAAGGSPVGEDAYPTHDSDALVDPVSEPIAADANNLWNYVFVWRAVGLVNGDYTVEVSFDGGSTWEDDAICMENLTYDSGEVVTPEFIIVKTGTASVCSTTEGLDINYSLTVTNLGPGESVIDYVEDELDDSIQDSWVSNITSSSGMTGTVSSGVIRWDGTLTQRTFAEDQSETYTYTVSIPGASVSVVVGGLENIGTVTYNTNQSRFTYYIRPVCAGLPSTGISDNTPLILGLFAIATGLIALRLKAGQQLVYPVLSTGSNRAEILFEKISPRLGFGHIIAEKKRKKMEENFSDEENE